MRTSISTHLNTFHQDQQDIEIDLTKCENHAYNQASTKLDRFDMLCDNQSTSDVIVGRCFVSNIRKCKYTLVLKTQSGVCRIDQIADIPGIGTVWFYPKGVANILLLNRMIKKSGWDIDFSSRGWRTTNNAHDLA